MSRRKAQEQVDLPLLQRRLQTRRIRARRNSFATSARSHCNHNALIVEVPAASRAALLKSCDFHQSVTRAPGRSPPTSPITLQAVPARPAMDSTSATLRTLPKEESRLASPKKELPGHRAAARRLDTQIDFSAKGRRHRIVRSITRRGATARPPSAQSCAERTRASLDSLEHARCTAKISASRFPAQEHGPP
jgi:hypothetical protein